MRSLAGRLLLLGILPSALVIGGILGWGMVDKHRALGRIAESELEHQALAIAVDVAESNLSAMQAARSIAVQQESGLFGDRARTIDILRGLLAADGNVTAAYVAYEPDADGKDAASLATDPKEWMDAAGRFIPYPFRDWQRGDAIGVKPLVDYETSLYYDGVRRAFAATGESATMVTEPYVYDGQLVVEQAHPIVIDGRFRGVGAVDRALASIESMVRARAAEVGASAYLVSSRGRFIVATEDPAFGSAAAADAGMELRTREVADTALRALVAPLMRDASTHGFVTQAVDPRDGSELLAVSVRIRSGDWTLVCTKPREVVMAPIRAELWLTAGVFAGGLLLSVGLVAWIAVSTGRRVREAAVAADRIAGGDLQTTVPACSLGDEAGVLLRSLGRMKSSLNQLLTGVRGAGVTLDSSALQLSAASREQEQVAHRFGESSAQIASATREISATGAELARTMAEVDGAVERTAGLADGARGNLASVDGTIRELADATGSIAAKLAAISERASSINGVVTTIAKVADQTNLLSVNAAIEAEKAGEQGRGFLVVAREIRRLADQTAAATGDIESIVREMQSAVGAGVMEMDRFSDKVRRGVDEVVTSSQQMNDIIAQVEANAERFRTVTSGMASQSQGAATISESMVSLVSAAKRAVESAEEFGRTAAELERTSRALRASVGEFRLESRRD
jgi:methyl-accepting chemotaxis protein